MFQVPDAKFEWIWCFAALPISQVHLPLDSVCLVPLWPSMRCMQVMASFMCMSHCAFRVWCWKYLKENGDQVLFAHFRMFRAILAHSPVDTVDIVLRIRHGRAYQHSLIGADLDSTSSVQRSFKEISCMRNADGYGFALSISRPPISRCIYLRDSTSLTDWFSHWPPLIFFSAWDRRADGPGVQAFMIHLSKLMEFRGLGLASAYFCGLPHCNGVGS